jgi:16S rRNA (cytosine1402-N4)-methyltransferase
MESAPHRPVLLQEMLQAFSGLALHVVVDGTLGAGGHAEALLQEHPEIRHYLGIDRDPAALLIAQDRLAPWAGKMCYKQGNFEDFDNFLQELSLPKPEAILVDLGVSSMQVDQPSRGFSFMHDGPLDMRMDPALPLTAADIVNQWSEEDLGRVFRTYGEEKQWKKAARAIVKARETGPILTTGELRNLLNPILARHAKKGIQPVTLIFQALRICVNQELEALEAFLPKALNLLQPGGRLAVISFHSLEDRIVKNEMRFAASDKWNTAGLSGMFLDKQPSVKLVTKKPIRPTDEEMNLNPRSRCAKIRIVERLGG